jgi:hypothetical protein
MAENTISENNATHTSQDNPVIDKGTYEIIRQRLASTATLLSDNLSKMNASRKEVFGGIDTVLLSSERITTTNNCIPRDMTTFGNKFLFGYNVQFGLKSTTNIEDVFSVYSYKNNSFSELNLNLIKDDKFERDFVELYKYYKNTFLAKFTIKAPFLYQIFQIGKEFSDAKTFKWQIDGENLKYLDNRSGHEISAPPQYEFEWKRTRREQFRTGLHPHISIEDRLFVETIGGDLTIKLEDNTDSGKGIYSEPVDNKDQTLDDAEIYYVLLGNIIILKIRPFQETLFRYLVFSSKTEKVQRIDSIDQACILLPDNSGIIFPNGYFLQTGTCKLFDSSISNLKFEKKIAAPNGEDYHYIFYNSKDGLYVLLPYNRIEQSIDAPVIAHGYAYFENGEMVLLKAENEPRSNHVIQIWQTPFYGPKFNPPQAKTDSLYFKIGNKDIVKCMADCNAVLSLLNKDDSYSNLYIDITRDIDRILDSYFWIDKVENGILKENLIQIRKVSSTAIEEFEKVKSLKKSAHEALAKTEQRLGELITAASKKDPASIERYVKNLSDLRSIRGEVISLKSIRYVNVDNVNEMDNKVKEHVDVLSQICTDYLLTPEGLLPYRIKSSDIESQIDSVKKTLEGKKLDEQIDSTGKELELLIEVVSNLKIEDSTQATQIIDQISSIYTELNRIRSKLRSQMKTLRAGEGTAEFSAQIKLLDQSIVNYIDIVETPEKCDEFLTKVLVQFEEIESKFTDFDEFIPKLAQKRTEVYQAFESKKNMLQEQRSRTCIAYIAAAERIIKGIENRVKTLPTQNEINGFFASDLMVEKVRDIIEKLTKLGDTVKADDIQSKLKTIKEELSRQLKDKNELFTEGANTIRLGKHLFSVNTNPLELSLVYKDLSLYYHLTGTDFMEKVVSTELENVSDIWSQEIVSENDKVYRAEFLAWKIVNESLNGNMAPVNVIAEMKDIDLAALVSKFMAPLYDEGYLKGVHDHDAALLLKELTQSCITIDLLTFEPSSRALARIFWMWPENEDVKKRVDRQLKGLNHALKAFNADQKLQCFVDILKPYISKFCSTVKIFTPEMVDNAARYLCLERQRGDIFIISSEADAICKSFLQAIKDRFVQQKFIDSINALHEDPAAQFELIHDWIHIYFDECGTGDLQEFVDEAAVLIALEHILNQTIRTPLTVIQSPTLRTVSGMRGEHALIVNNSITFTYSRFAKRLAAFLLEDVPRYLEYQHIKKSLIQKIRDEMRLEEFKPKVLSSFVRNKLINDVYLPLVGDNFAKQLGAAGDKKRTDLMGMLLLISPPGYGKTTLMEYVASRIGLIFMKINGPAIGNKVTSLDPAEAPHASAREELNKLNLALEMGNNVMIYVDDIQHCNPEFLEKFISLCDAQRKIEGVYKSNCKTYDLRGKKVAVVMAGNPYTESGERFKVPDMLANRADTYNLGDMLRANETAFKLSYLENSFSSNQILSDMATRNSNDIYSIIDAIEKNNRENCKLEGDYTPETLNDIFNVTAKLLIVRDIILKVNQEYIRSAAQANEYRTEPPFKLQGSYRNMNRIAERVLPVMNDQELFSLVIQSYENDAQTLTTGAEANLLKWKELTNSLSEKDQIRWDEIKKSFNQFKLVKSDDKTGQALLQLGKISDGLGDLRTAIQNASSSNNTDKHDSIVKIDPDFVKLFNENFNTISTILQNKGDQSASNEPQYISALVMIMENQMKIMQEWLSVIQNSSEKQSSNTEELQKAINRSMWFQKELVSRFLKEERQVKKAKKNEAGNPEGVIS